MGEGQDATGHSFRPRVSVKEAAKHLGTTVDAIRKPAQRGTIAHDKDADGRVWIVLDTDRTRHVGDQGEAGQRHHSESGVLVSEMRGRIEDLREQLEAERQAYAKSRPLLAAALERIPAIEVPQEPADAAETVEKEPERAEPRGRCGRVSGGRTEPLVASVVRGMSALWDAALALILFVITQGVLKFVIEPIQELRRLIGEVTHELSMHYYLQDVQEDGVDEVRKTLRSLSARLWVSLWAIPFYNAFARVGAVPKLEDVVAASTELKAWARHLGSPVSSESADAMTRNIVAVSERLDIRIRIPRSADGMRGPSKG